MLSDEKKKREQKRKAPKLSFDSEEQEAPRKRQSKLSFEDEDEQAPIPPRRLAKDPTANTSFLPDRDREEADRLERENLRKQWLAEQDRIRDETIEITYSYWDGSGHRKTVEVCAYLLETT